MRRSRADEPSRQLGGPVTWQSHDRVQRRLRAALLLVEMSILASCRSVLRTFRAHPAHGDGACGLHAAIASACARQQLWTRHRRVVSRGLSSESKDELRVRYLDGRDSGERRSVSAPARVQMWLHLPVITSWGNVHVKVNRSPTPTDCRHGDVTPNKPILARVLSTPKSTIWPRQCFD